MKNILKMLGFTVIITVIGFSIAACGDDNGGTGGGGPATGLDEVVVENQQVYTYQINEETGKLSWTDFKGNLSFKSLPSYVEISVTGGKLNLTLNTPNEADLGTVSSFSNYFNEGFDMYKNQSISDESVKMVIIREFEINGNNYDSLFKGNETVSRSGNSGSQTSERAFFIYVDNPVVIKADGVIEQGENKFGGDTYINKFTSSKINLSLEKGWNVLHMNYKLTVSYNSTTSTYNDNRTISISVGNPNSLRWVYN
ncbi:MAG: lactonase family protein [Treponema sp.]|nr:lactonase family protein [Treponema sp.]MCL2251642.1 lactonase family protein [Treponema sp.]